MGKSRESLQQMPEQAGQAFMGTMLREFWSAECMSSEIVVNKQTNINMVSSCTYGSISFACAACDPRNGQVLQNQAA